MLPCRSWLDRHAGHEVVVIEDSDEPVVGLVFDFATDGEEIYLGAHEPGQFARDVITLEEYLSSARGSS